MSINDDNIHAFVRDYLNSPEKLPGFLRNKKINDWDVSKVTNMSELFINANINEPLNKWDVSNVTDMSAMFLRCDNFNFPLDSWNVSNVTTMDDMFSICTEFNQPLESWNVSKVINMSFMFNGCYNFNQPLNNWNVSNVTDMSSMFSECYNFNQPLNLWDVTNVTDMSRMFSKCLNFNAPLNSWNVNNVTDYELIFQDCHILESNAPLFKFGSILPSPIYLYQFNTEIENGTIIENNSQEDDYHYTRLFEMIYTTDVLYYNIEALLDAAKRMKENKSIQTANGETVLGFVISAYDYYRSHVKKNLYNELLSILVRDFLRKYPKEDECVICNELMDGIHGPTNPMEGEPVNQIVNNPNDVITVCANSHVLHRQCSISTCTAPPVNILEQMSMEGEYLSAQSISTLCPLCKQPLLPSCEGFNNKKKLPLPFPEEIEFKGGRKTNKRKTNKRKTNKRKTNKRKK